VIRAYVRSPFFGTFSLVPYKGCAAGIVSLAAGERMVVQLSEAVKERNPNKLATIDVNDLRVFKNKHVFQQGGALPLKSDALVDGLGQSMEEALVVRVCDEAEDNVRHQLEHP
jgi:hypothetical protein